MLNNDKKLKVVKLCKCGKNPATEPHTCPYDEEIFDSKKLCTCCEECQHECLMEI